jgi:hypothetical protein
MSLLAIRLRKGRFNAIDLRHPHVTHDDIEHEAVLPSIEDLNGSLSIFGFQHVVPSLLQHRPGDTPDIRLIIHNQDATIVGQGFQTRDQICTQS